MPTWKSGANAPLGQPNPGQVDDTAKVAIGTIGTFFDETQGEGKFIYLPGVANTVAGDIVIMDLTPGAQTTTRLAKDAANNSGRPVAFASAAIVATKFGWYQIEGVAIVNVVAGTAAGVMMNTATTGSVGNTADAGDQVLNARVLTAVGTPAANQSYAHIQRPFVQGQIT